MKTTYIDGYLSNNGRYTMVQEGKRPWSKECFLRRLGLAKPIGKKRFAIRRKNQRTIKQREYGYNG